MKALALALFALFAAGLARAQVRDYGFAVEGPIGRPSFFYGGSSDEGDQVLFEVPTIDSMVHYPGASQYIFMNNGIASTDSVVSGPGFPIGFDFGFDGEVFDRFGVSANMYLKLGKSSDGLFSMYNDTAAGGVFQPGRDTLRASVVAALQTSSNYLKTYQLTVKTGLFGYPGERIRKVYIFHWKNIAGFPHWHIAYFSLLERDQTVNLFYFTRWLPANTDKDVFCGLRGNNSSEPVDSNFKSIEVKQGINTWKTPLIAHTPNEWCDYKNGFTPDSISYSFTPPFIQRLPSCPTAYFKEAGPTNPGYIAVQPSNSFVSNGYYFANGAVQVPTNPTLWWSPGDLRDTLLFDVYLGLDSVGLWLVGEDVTTNSLPLGFLAANTRYYYKVVAKNGMGNSPSCVGSFTVGAKIEYCIPSYQAHSNGIYESLSLHTFLYTHPAPGTVDTQKYFPPVAPYTTTLKRDSSYIMSYTKLPATPTCHTVKVWIDFDRNGSFSDLGEEFSGNSTVTVPTHAKLGPTGMRVMARSSCVGVNLQPCSGNNSYQDFTITIAPSTACSSFVLSHTANGPLCHGGSSGSVVLALQGGTPPYAISWEHMGNTLPATGDTLQGLATGTYQAFVTDAAGCQLQTPIIPLIQPYQFVVDTVTIANELTPLASGGTPPYFFEWLDSSGTVADSLVPGTYTLVGTDLNGCTGMVTGILIHGIPDTNPCPLPPCDTIPNPCPDPPCDTVGLGAIQNEGMFAKLYPNPASATLYLTISRAGTFELYNLFGERIVLLNLEQANTPYVLDIGTLASGVYLYRFKVEDAVQLGKVVIQH